MPEADIPEGEKPDSISYRAPGSERKTPVKSDPPPDKRTGIDFITSVIVCGVVGALIDRAFGTFPRWFLIMGFLGIGGGMWNVWQSRRRGK